MLQTCAKCGRDNPASATAGQLCEHPLSAAEIPREFDDRVDLRDYQIDQVRQDIAHRGKIRRRWRRVGLFLLIASLPFAGWRGVQWFRWTGWGRLPTPEQIQRDMKLWPLAKCPTIIRGRPLTAIPFTVDASQADYPAAFDLCLDESGHPIALVAAILEQPGAAGLLDFDAYAEFDNTPNSRARLNLLRLLSFSRLYLESAPLMLEPIKSDAAAGRLKILSAADQRPADDPAVRELCTIYAYRRLNVEMTVRELYDESDQVKARHWFWIIKSRDW